jgi:glycosyltransferase involved in cell wall biosynthesis
VAQTVCVIVPARDAAAHLPALLAGLAAQRRAPDQVLVVDDGSSDGTARLAGEHPVVTEVLHGGGRGPGAARNTAAAHTRADVLAFTDADCAPAPGWLEAGLAAIAEADLVQGRVEPPPEAELDVLDRTIWVTQAHGLFETANLLVRRELFERIGGFEPWLQPKRSKELGEDVWLGYRARRAGARIAFAPDALVHHAVFKRGAADFVAERTRLRFFPVMTARLPELRDTFLHRRYFLSRRSLAFDAAVLGAGVALLARKPLAAALALPYARMLRADRRYHGIERTAALAAADAVGFGALVYGSAVARTVVL